MLIITKENNSIKVVGQNNPTYPYSGTLVYPLNSVTVVTDQSDMAVFRSALNNDVLFTGLIENITIAGSTVTKEDIGTKFGQIANSSGSGGGGTGGAVDSVNGQAGTVVLTASDVNAYSKTESDAKYATKGEIPSTDNFATKEELAGKADTSSLDNYLLKTDAQSTYETISGAQGKYQAKLTAGTGIEITGENVINVTLDTNIYQVVESLPEDSINPNKIYLVLNSESGESDLYIEYLYVNNKWEKIGEYKADVDLTPYLTKADAANTYQPKGEYLTSIPEEYVTDTELEGKGYALNTSLEAEVTERQKQDSALGGMIAGETQAREQAITNLTATVQGKLDTATYNSEKATFETKENAAATYQPKGSYLTSIPEEYVTDTELNEKGYATQDWVTEQGYLTEHQDISGLATKEELNGKQNTLVSGTNIKTINSQSLLGEGNIEITVQGGGITDAPNDGKLYGRKSEQWTEVVIPDTSNLATKAELGAKLDTATYNEEKATFALKTEIPNVSNLATKQEVTEGLAGKANTSDLSNYLTTEAAQSTYATKGELGAKLDVETYNSEKATFALKSELPDTSDFITKATADETYQPKGEYLTSVPDNYVTDEELNGKGYATTEQLNAKQDALVSGTNIKTVNGNSLLGSGDITIEGGTGSGVKEWDFAQLQSDAEYRTNFITNAKASDIVNNVSYQSTTYDHCSILCIKGSTYTLLLNIVSNPMIAPLTVVENNALITSAINIYPIVDNTLSDDSINPVQNKVIKAELDKMASAKNHDLSTYGGAINAGDTLTNVGSYKVPKSFVCVYTDMLNVIAIGMNAEGKDIVINLKNENVEGTWKWNVKSEIEIGGGTGTSYTAGNGINISEENVISVDSVALDIPTRQTGEKGTTNNFIYSDSGNGQYRAVSAVSIGTFNKKLMVRGRYWGQSDNSSINLSVAAIPEASSNTNGLLSINDKSKLDTLQTEWFGTQSQFDEIVEKDNNTLYFITEE